MFGPEHQIKSEDIEEESLVNKDRGLIVGRKTEAEDRMSWESDFTNPENHDDQQYCYLIHGTQIGGAAAQKSLLFLQSGDYDSESHVDLFEEPQRIAEKKMISASIINQTCRGTWGGCGFILNAPYENAIAAYREDAGTQFDWEKMTKSATPVPTVPEILEATYPTAYNEIVLAGSTQAGNVSIRGIWAKVDKGGIPIDEDGFYQARGVATRLGIPFVQIPQESIEWEDRGPELSRDLGNKVDFIAFQRNGLRYCFTLRDKKSEFIILDENTISKNMSRAEFEYAYGILQQELTEAEKTEIANILESLPVIFRENPLPEVTYGYQTKEPQYCILDRGRIRYILGFSSDRSEVIDSSIDRMRTMTREDFEYVKGELMRELEDKDLEALKRILPEIETRFS